MEARLYRWAWVLTAVAALALGARLLRYQVVPVESGLVVWDRLRHQWCLPAGNCISVNAGGAAAVSKAGMPRSEDTMDAFEAAAESLSTLDSGTRRRELEAELHRRGVSLDSVRSRRGSH